MKKETTGDRLTILIREEFNGSRNKFCNDTGVSDGTLKNVITNRKRPGTSSFNDLILNVRPTFNVTWLLTGQGEMFLPDVTVLRTEIEDLKTLVEFLKKNRF